MIIVVASIAAILTVPLTGRSLAPLAKLSLRRVWLVWLSIGLQLVITLVPDFPNWLGQPAAPVHVRVVRRVPVEQSSPPRGAAGGTRSRPEPGRHRCQRRHDAGLAVGLAHRRVPDRSTVSSRTRTSPAHARLWWFLGDVFAIPKGWPLANVFSVGDVVIVIAIDLLRPHLVPTQTRSPDDGQPTVDPVLAIAD